MSKESLNHYQAQQKRVSFIERAVGEGILERIPVSERNQNIVLVSVLNETSTDEELGRIFPQPSGKPIVRAYVSHIRKTFLRKAWEQVSPALQTCYPLEELLMKKPMPLRTITLQVKNAVEKGIKPQDIGLPVLPSTSRDTLRKRGIEVPSRLPYGDFEERVKAAGNDYKKLQEILDSFPGLSLCGYINNHRKDKEKTLTYLSPVLREGGFHFRNRFVKLFARRLQIAGVPVRKASTKDNKQTYWVAYASYEHRKKIIDALKDDPDLQKFRENPVQLVCGNFDGKMPTTSDFTKRKRSKQYGTNIREIIREATGYYPTGKGRLKPENFLSGCPVPVFRCHSDSTYIYPLDRTEELKSFLESKLKKSK